MASKRSATQKWGDLSRAQYSFSISNAAGVRLRSAARVGESETFADSGIHANAQESRSELEAVLRAAA